MKLIPQGARLWAVVALFVGVLLSAFWLFHFQGLRRDSLALCADDLLSAAVGLLVCAVIGLAIQAVMLVRLLATRQIQVSVAVIYIVVDVIGLPVLLWGITQLWIMAPIG